jgi:hypothetical protein
MTAIYRDDNGKLWLLGRMVPLWLLLWDWAVRQSVGRPPLPAQENWLRICNP